MSLQILSGFAYQFSKKMFQLNWWNMALAVPTFWVWCQKAFKMTKCRTWKHCKSLWIKLSVKCINGGKRKAILYLHICIFTSFILYIEKMNSSGSFLPLNGTLVMVFNFWWVWVLRILLMPICMSCDFLIAKGKRLPEAGVDIHLLSMGLYFCSTSQNQTRLHYTRWLSSSWNSI